LSHHKPAAVRQQNRTADPPTATNSRSSVLCANVTNRPRRYRAAVTSLWVSRRDGARFVGSSACKWPDRRHEAASPSSQCCLRQERPGPYPRGRRQATGPCLLPLTTPQRARCREVHITLYDIKDAPLICIKEASAPPLSLHCLVSPARTSVGPCVCLSGCRRNGPNQARATNKSQLISRTPHRERLSLWLAFAVVPMGKQADIIEIQSTQLEQIEREPDYPWQH
jgi:hypothetical protein